MLVLLAGIWGCVPLSSTSQEMRSLSHPKDRAPIQVSDLAGVWEYEERNVVYPLTFDENGNGTYEWKDGRFTTTSIEGRTWKGTWSQRENDREGGFEIQLSHDGVMATGRWWYTRIEQVHNPLNPGGTFTLTRRSVETK
ncbi:MAG: hypothetical protein NPIRA02_17480 [Nitrospirales bacterium]|nr:MAG: hypothetical protein NPIRA02_17480 [Nitrospirales bacterium]